MLSVTVRLKKIVITLISVLAFLAVFIFSNQIRQGILKGLTLCFQSVIPSLFLFTALSLFIAYSGVAKALGRLISPVTRLLLGLEGSTATTFLLSAVSGYPVGAKLVNDLYVRGEISHEKALKMLTFCVNAGPSFIILAVGKATLNSVSDGQRLLLAHITATLVLAASIRFLPDRFFLKSHQKEKNTVQESKLSLTVSDAFVMSVSEAGKTIINICTFVVFFSAIEGLVLSFGSEIMNEVSRLLEVTVGVQSLSRKSLSKVSFLLGFGGISVIFQVMAAANKIKPDFKLILVSRVAHGLLSAGIIAVLEKLFSRTIETVQLGRPIQSNAFGTTPVATISLMLLLVVLLGFIKSKATQTRGKSKQK